MIVETISRSSHTTRQRILDAASKEFAERGFAGARVDEIALRAGVNKALLYYHVGNKQAIYSAVLTRNFDRVEGALATVIDRGGSARGRLSAVISTVTEILRAYPEHSRIVLRELASAGSNLETEVFERMLQIVGIVGGLLADGVRGGELRKTDPFMTHLTLIGASLILSAIAPLRARATAFSSDIQLPDDDVDIAGFLGDLLLHGIAATRNGEIT
jgi:AcrR family transcriptional regulator